MSACIFINYITTINFKNKPANRAKHDATVQYDDDNDNSVLQ